MADFATRPDVVLAYGGSSLPGSEDRTDSLLRTASARLRILLPTLQAAVAADPEGDIALLAKDVVVQAVIRKLPIGDGTRGITSQTQTAGPWQHTVRYTEDASETFPDDDLELLRTALSLTTDQVVTGAATIRLGRPDWTFG